MTFEQLIDATFAREGTTYGDRTTQPPIDQPTAPGGIVLATLTAYLGRPATPAELYALTVETARPIVAWVLNQEATKHGFNRIVDEHVRNQMLDFGFNSGEALAIRWLQRVLGVPRSGVMDPVTVAAVNLTALIGVAGGLAVAGARVMALLNQALLAARLQMLSRAEASGTIDKHFDVGLENRAFSFSELEVP
jgi:lysozyme family protein